MIILTLAAMLLITGSVQADLVETAAGTAFQEADGKYASNVVKEIDGELYYFDTAGIMQKDGAIKTPTGQEYYATKTGALLRKTWRKKKFYYKDNGEKAKGVTEIGGNLYYFTLTKGKLKKGKLKDAEGKIYITDSRGVLYQGFFTYKYKRYYGTDQGNLATGLTTIGNHIYYFKLTNGRMIVNKRKLISGKYYYFQKNGRAAREKWVKYKGEYYYFQADGTMARNQFIGTKWYVGDDGVRMKASEAPKVEVRKVDGKIYLYDASGTMQVSKWVNSGQDTYYVGADGVAFVGLQTVGTAQYYFNEEGVLQKGKVVVVNGTAYQAGADGVILGVTTALGDTIAAEAQTYVGNPYVYGGTSLTAGADCSGFCYTLFGNHGIQLMRVADDQMDGPSAAYQALGYKVGTVVADADLLPGDLVFYGSASYATHVAIYIGNGQVCHAANTRLGIIVSSIDYVKNRVTNKNMRYWA